MIDYVYEVRGTDDPIEGDKVRFKTKDEAMAYYEEAKPNHPEAAVYIIEYEFDDYEGTDNMTSIPEQRTVVQIAGPGVETINTPDGFPDSCASDNSDNYDDNGMFRLPKYDDDLEDDDDDIETEAFAEELFSALSDKRDERAFPEGKLDLDAPHEDVPVVDCKVNPAITHAEDEKPLKEWVGPDASHRAEEFFNALDDEDHSVQMYIARKIVYGLVDDEASAQKLAAWGETLDLDEQLALDSLIADALEAANEHEALWDYLNDKSLPLDISEKADEPGKQNMDALLASCKSEEEKKDLLLQAMDCLIGAGLLY